MCAGAEAARNANENARRQYKYNLEVRKRKHMQKLSIYNANKVQFAQASQNIHTGMTAAFDRAQVKLRRVREATATKNQDALIKMFQNSKYGNLMTQGQSGRSIARIGVMENAALGQFYSRNIRNLTDAREDFMAGVKNTRNRAKIAREREFAKVAFQPVTDVAPPKPVMQNVGLAMFGDMLGFASTAMSFVQSERALKENIKKIGTAKSGLGIYKFNYIGYPDKKYIGAMVDEVEKIFPDAVGEQPGNYLGVNYNKIDVIFKEVA